MKYALITGQRIEAPPGFKAQSPIYSQLIIANRPVSFVELNRN